MRKQWIAALATTVLVASCSDAPTRVTTALAGGAVANAIVVDPGDPNTVTYTFDDLPDNNNWGTLLPNPYEDLVFLTAPFFYHTQSSIGNISLVGSNRAAYDGGFVHEVLIQLPKLASRVSVESYGMQPYHVPTIVAYDASGAVLATGLGTQSTFVWETISVSATDIARVGLQMGANENFIDNLKITYNPNPTTSDQCKNGGWAAFGFKNQGDCVRFVNTGKDGR